MKYFCTIQSMHSIRNLLRFRCRAGNLRQSSVCKTGIRVCIIVCCLCLTLHLLRTAFRALFIGKPQGDEQFEWLRRNRDVRQYILPEVNTTLLSPRMSCYDRLRLLILVASAPGNSEHRQAIRDTWGYAVPIHEARLLFFLGHDGNGRPLLTTESVLSEAQKYGDIVVEDFIDSYHNLTLKSVFMLKWTLKCCKSVPYVLKTDDDMLINVRALLQELEKSKYRPSQPLIIGRIQEGSLPYRDRLSKWYLPHWLYEETTFPTFASGTGYVMTQKAVSELYPNALDTPLLPLEDVFLTGVVATKILGIPLISEPRFHNDRPLFSEHPCLYHHLLTVHDLTPKQLRRLWIGLSTLKQTKCDSFYARFLAYFFGTGQYKILTDVAW